MKKYLLCIFLLAVFNTQAVAGPLHDAARDGDVERVKTLIAEGEDVNKRNQ